MVRVQTLYVPIVCKFKIFYLVKMFHPILDLVVILAFNSRISRTEICFCFLFCVFGHRNELPFVKIYSPSQYRLILCRGQYVIKFRRNDFLIIITQKAYSSVSGSLFRLPFFVIFYRPSRLKEHTKQMKGFKYFLRVKMSTQHPRKITFLQNFRITVFIVGIFLRLSTRFLLLFSGHPFTIL